jgi:hypothetical protein
LFVSDISTNGSLSSGVGRGVIYQIKALVGPSVVAQWANDQVEVTWKYGVLQSSPDGRDNWSDVTNVSPYRADPTQPRRFFRSRH